MVAEQIRPVASLREYFKNSLADAMANRQIDADDQTACYVVNLLTLFARSEALFDATEEGPDLKPLALVFAEAIEATRPDERNHALQRLGDVALFVAGFFGEGMGRRPVDVDYYVSMGGAAYGALSESIRGSVRGRAFSVVFAELAYKFQDFVDALAEIKDEAGRSEHVDILRTYEMWIRTGSPRAAEKLRASGIEPNRLLSGETRH